MTEQPQKTEQVDWKRTTVLGLRFFQVIAVALVAVGFIWGAGDLILSMLPPDSPVTPLSCLLMLYGVIGSLIIEAAIRVLERKK